MIIGFCLAILTILSTFSIILGNNYISTNVDTTIEGSQIINGSSSTYELSVASEGLYIDPVQGAIIIIIIIAVIVGAITFQILGSGLGQTGQKLVSISISYGGIWSILSVLAFPLITSIEIFGGLIYVGLTILYVIGIIRKKIGSEI